MAPRSGLSSTFGIAKETTPGVAVAPTSFQPLVSDGMTNEAGRVESEGVIAGRQTMDSTQWNGGTTVIGGDMGFELYDRGLGKYAEACMGGYSGPSGGGPYTHVFTPADLSSWTAQVGRPNAAGGVDPYTYSGSKVASWEIACAVNAVATFGITWASMFEQAGSRVVTDGVTTSGSATITSATAAFSDADQYASVSGTGVPAGTKIASVTNATTAVLSANATASGTGVSLTIGLALATPSYVADRHLLKFNHGSVSVGGTALKVMQATLGGDNGLKTDRNFLGQRNAEEALQITYKDYTGTLAVEYMSTAEYRRYLAGQEMSLSMTYSVGLYSLNITENIRYEPGATPNVDPKNITPQNLPFKAIGAGTDASACTWTMISPDATI